MAIELLNIDCMEYMKTLPGKAFDLAVVDPPYGLNIAANTNYGESGGSDGRWNTTKKDFYTAKDWDKNVPDGKYFDELFRVSKHQIIWGWNYYVQYLNTCPSYIVWNKKASGNYSDCETAWCSIPGVNRIFEHLWNGFRKDKPEDRIHPTQKPRALYKWLFENYAETGWKILDTHLGSGSIAIVADKMGFDFVGCEIDKEYFDNAVARWKSETDLGLFTNAFEKGEGSVGGFFKTF